MSNRRGPKGGNPFGHKMQCRCSPECTEFARAANAAYKRTARAELRAKGFVMHHGKPARPSTQPTGIRHGTRASYVAGCRCDECKAGSATYMADYRARKLSPNGVKVPRWPPDPIPQPAKPTPDRIFERADWMQWGECVGMDPDIWFPQHVDNAAFAKSICAGCPVRKLCLDYALDNREQFGIWGGMSPRERRVILRRRAA